LFECSAAVLFDDLLAIEAELKPCLPAVDIQIEREMRDIALALLDSPQPLARVEDQPVQCNAWSKCEALVVVLLVEKGRGDISLPILFGIVPVGCVWGFRAGGEVECLPGIQQH